MKSGSNFGSSYGRGTGRGGGARPLPMPLPWFSILNNYRPQCKSLLVTVYLTMLSVPVVTQHQMRGLVNKPKAYGRQ